MQMRKKIITLVPEAQARKGERFKVNITPTCDKCENFRFCVRKLRKGFTYEIVEIRQARHFCPAAKDYMNVVVVIELPVKILLPKKIAFEGAVIEVPKIECNFRKCKNWKLCHVEGLKPGEKIKICEIITGSFECPLGQKLSLVAVQPVE